MKFGCFAFLILIIADGSAASATYITFAQGTIDTVSTINFGSGGTLSGSIPIDTIGTTVNNSSAVLTFSLTGATSDGQGGYLYSGGSFSIYGDDYGTGSINEYLLTGQFLSGTELALISSNGGISTYQFSPLASFGKGSIAPDLEAVFGDSGSIVGGTFSLSFQVSSGNTISNIGAQVVAQSFSVPEPPSAMLAMIALSWFAIWRMRFGQPRLDRSPVRC
jgi:hypothetical protein